MLRVDSRKVLKGDTYLDLSNGKYVMDAINNGASLIISEKDYEFDTLIVADVRNYLSNYLKERVNLNDIKLIGITGTNGKTTSCYLTYQLLNLLNLKTAYIGTIGFYIDDKIKDLNNTTPDLYELYEMFDICIKEDVKVIVMEVSSHSLELDRLRDINFDIAAFTNLTLDHIDFHVNMDNYLNAKRKLFDKLRNDKLGILNSDSIYYDKFLVDNTITYGLNGDIKLIDYNLFINKSIFRILVDSEYEIELNIPCLYNIYNYLNAFIIAYKLGFDIEDIICKTKLLKAPKGRFQVINYGDNAIIIDYAHTPDAVNNILDNVNKYRTGKLITIIGCGGSRDKSKRSIMGLTSTINSDYVIFTNDNPRDEEEMDIINDIISEINTNNYEVITDRSLAIKKGINLLDKDDILLILGKGHEEYQIIKNEKFPFSDFDTVLQYIKKEV